MKKTKLIATIGATALIGAIGIGSTFAYLVDKTETVTNTFTVGNVTFDEKMKGGLAESEVVKNDKGEYIDNDGETWTVTENLYEDLYAGQELLKDPTVKLSATSQDAWVYAKITIQNEDAVSVTDWSEDWVNVTDAYKAAHTEDVGDYYVYAKSASMTKNETSTIFNHVTIADTVTDKTEIGTITVKACAVQKKGFDSYTDAISEVVFE